MSAVRGMLWVEQEQRHTSRTYSHLEIQLNQTELEVGRLQAEVEARKTEGADEKRGMGDQTCVSEAGGGP